MYDINEMSPFEQGYEAYLNGEKFKTCPYSDGRLLTWRNGYREAREVHENWGN